MLDDKQQFQELKTELLSQLQAFSLQHGPFPTQNLIVNFTSPLPFLSLLKGQTATPHSPLLPHLYWSNKEKSTTYATLGAIETVQTIPKASDDAFYIGGLAFQQQGAQWQDFPDTLFIRPLMVFAKTHPSSFKVTFHFNGQHALQNSIDAVQQLAPPQALRALPPQTFLRSDFPNQAEWAELVDKAIEYKALLPKVVLSRETQLQTEQAINTWDLMELWRTLNPDSFHYVLQFSAQQQFISCSPERLFSRQQRSLLTEALAGTVNRGKDHREDALLAQSLLNDKKIDRENYLVQESIVANLKQLKAEVTCEPARVTQLHHVQHLCVPIHAKLSEITEDRDLLYKLHPTPAVGGSPKLPALQFINDNEPYTRGWYAGAVGYISEQESDFSVAIRSALISQTHLKLFAGAGIVTGSIAEQEWQELDNKIHTLLSILGVQKNQY